MTSLFFRLYRKIQRHIKARLGRESVIRMDLHHEWSADFFHGFLENAVQSTAKAPKVPKAPKPPKAPNFAVRNFIARIAKILEERKSLFFWNKAFIFRSIALFAMFFLVNNAPAYWRYVKASLLAFEPAPSFEELSPLDSSSLDGVPLLDFHVVSHDDRIRIPSLQVNAPIVLPDMDAEALSLGDWSAIEKAIHKSLAEGVVHYPGTAKPFEYGNFFLTGHSSNVLWEPSPFNTVFALLPKIEIGAEIIIDYRQKRYVYIVKSKKEVTPQTVEVLSQEGAKRLTLMTCTPVGTTLKRLIVEAEPQL